MRYGTVLAAQIGSISDRIRSAQSGFWISERCLAGQDRVWQTGNGFFNGMRFIHPGSARFNLLPRAHVPAPQVRLLRERRVHTCSNM
jgi:hypothetical protein